MNIANLGAEKTITVELVHPGTKVNLTNSDKTKMCVSLFAPHTAEYKKAERKTDRSKEFKEIQNGVEFKDLTPEQLYQIDDLRNQRRLELITQIIESCNIDGEDGEKIDIKTLCRWLKKESHGWIVTQLDNEVGKGEVFINAWPKS